MMMMMMMMMMMTKGHRFSFNLEPLLQHKNNVQVCFFESAEMEKRPPKTQFLSASLYVSKRGAY